VDGSWLDMHKYEQVPAWTVWEEIRHRLDDNASISVVQLINWQRNYSVIR